MSKMLAALKVKKVWVRALIRTARVLVYAAIVTIADNQIEFLKQLPDQWLPVATAILMGFDKLVRMAREFKESA